MKVIFKKMEKRKVKIPQYEVVIGMENLQEHDNVYLLQIEIHHALKRARIKNMPNRYEQSSMGLGLMQFFIPQDVYDEELIEDIAKVIIGEPYIDISIGIKE